MSSLSFSLKKCCLIRRVFDYTFSKICTILLFVHGLFCLKVIIGANFHFPHLISGVFDILATIYCAVIPKIISALPIMTTLPAVHNVNTPEIDTDSETRKNSDCSSSLDTFKYLTWFHHMDYFKNQTNMNLICFKAGVFNLGTCTICVVVHTSALSCAHPQSQNWLIPMTNSPVTQ